MAIVIECFASLAQSKQAEADLEEEGIVEDELGRGDAQLEDAVVDGLRGLHGAQGLLQVAVEAPQLQAAVQPPLHRPLLLLLRLLRRLKTLLMPAQDMRGAFDKHEAKPPS